MAWNSGVGWPQPACFCLPSPGIKALDGRIPTLDNMFNYNPHSFSVFICMGDFQKVTQEAADGDCLWREELEVLSRKRDSLFIL